MKRVIAMCLVVILAMGGIVCTAEAEKAIRTDITAEIDYTPIETYNVNGFTYVPVDILHNYGFEVEYKDGNTINVNRIRYATPMFTRELWEDSIREKTYADIITDDKKVYLDVNPANSVSTTDGVLMMIDELQKYGGFSWNEDKKDIEIRIFEKELIQDYNDANNIKEIKTSGEEIYGLKETFGTYAGQLNENNLPDGVGHYEFQRANEFRIHEVEITGYFSDGKPNGYIHRKFSEISRSTGQKLFESDFIGVVNSSKEVVRILWEEDRQNTNVSRNFGAVAIPYDRYASEEKREENESKILFYFNNYLYDPNFYESGVYCDSSYKSWKRNKDQTEEIYKGYSKIYVGRGDTFSNSEGILKEFRQYCNEKEVLFESSYEVYKGGLYTVAKEVYYNEGLQTISDTMDEFGSLTLNSPSDGAGFYPSKIDIIFNGNRMERYEISMMNDRIMIPCRTFFEDIGATVEWVDTHEKWTSGGEVTIRKDGRVVVLNTKNNIMIVNGEEREIDTTPTLLDRKTYIPLRAVAEALDATVEWDEDLKDVIITL